MTSFLNKYEHVGIDFVETFVCSLILRRLHLQRKFGLVPRPYWVEVLFATSADSNFIWSGSLRNLNLKLVLPAPRYDPFIKLTVWSHRP